MFDTRTTYINSSNITDVAEEGNFSHDSPTEVVLFLFLAFAVGAAVRHLLKNTPLPYTVILIVIGLIIGALPKLKFFHFMQDYLMIAQLDPHLMLIIFLPTLIFESAFVMDVHTFKKTIVQSIMLAGPGLLISTFLTSLLGKFIFTYDWSWVVALLFGTITSATDPVAVVALLKELGASKQLGIIIEGESLLNDGAAIVLFNVLLDELIPNKGRTALQMFLYFLRVAIGGPVFGYFMAKFTIMWLSRVYNDALVEIGITLVSTYVTFYIGEQLLQVSGVLAIVTLGIEINSRKTNISPEVEAFLHRFWEVLEYLANTLIFILVGVVISQRAFQDVESKDWMFVITLYFGVMVIRFLVNSGLFPILKRVGYTVMWKDVVIITWGGLRGAVGLALALVVAQTSDASIDKIGCKILFHSAGLVILTLLINATTMKYLLQLLGMREISGARCKTMSSAVARVNEEKNKIINILKADRFLADADWSIVKTTGRLRDPYNLVDTRKDKRLVNSMNGHCPQCEIDIPRVLNAMELEELAEEIRHMMIKSEKISYWKQFEHGVLSREAVRVLINLADTVLDTPDSVTYALSKQTSSFALMRLITLNDLLPFWKIPNIFVYMKQLIIYVSEWKSSTQYPPPVAMKSLRVFYIVALSPIFEWTMIGIIMVNVVCSALELALENNVAITVLDSLNYFFCAAYVIEAFVKIVGLRIYYWKSKWNIFDFVILIISLSDIVLKLSIPENNYTFSPSTLRLIRILRGSRLLKVFIPRLIKIVDYFINRRLRFGYDIGRGFVVGEEELLQQSDRIKLVHKEIAEEFIKRVEATRLEVIRSMGLIRKEHPGVALSVKTHQATRTVLNHCQDVVKQILSNGMLDETDANTLLKIIEKKMKCLENTPPSLHSPDPETAFANLHWLNGLDSEVVNKLREHAEIVQFDSRDHIVTQGDIADGVFIILLGLVKVYCVHSDGESTHEEVLDFFGAGTIVGEMAILSGKVRNASIICETDVQAFYINAVNLWNIMKDHPVLEARLWRIYGIRIAIVTLAKTPQYRNWSNSELSLLCESSYTVSAQTSSSTIFTLAEEHREIILVVGQIESVDTGEVLEGPCIVPKTFQQIMLLATPSLSRLLVITNESINEVSMIDESASCDSLDAQYTINTKVILQMIRESSVFAMGMFNSAVTTIVQKWRKLTNTNKIHPDTPQQNQDEECRTNSSIYSNLEVDTSGIDDTAAQSLKQSIRSINTAEIEIDHQQDGQPCDETAVIEQSTDVHDSHSMLSISSSGTTRVCQDIHIQDVSDSDN